MLKTSILIKLFEIFALKIIKVSNNKVRKSSSRGKLNPKLQNIRFNHLNILNN